MEDRTFLVVAVAAILGLCIAVGIAAYLAFVSSARPLTDDEESQLKLLEKQDKDGRGLTVVGREELRILAERKARANLRVYRR